MQHHSFSRLLLFLFCAIWSACLCACASDGPSAAHTSGQLTAQAGTPGNESSARDVRDNTPQVLTPEAPGTTVYGSDAVSIDVSNTAEGYVMVKYSGSADKIKVFIYTPDHTKYPYTVFPGDYNALPLTGKDGSYSIETYEHISGDTYVSLMDTFSIDVSLNDEFRPFLYPNQYTWFTADCTTVDKASELAAGAYTDLEVITNVYNYVIANITYDNQKAETVESDYLPDTDETLSSGTGICFDYAALMTAMLRSQRIPTKLEIGYSGEVYHAWISTYTQAQGWIDNVIQFDGNAWSLVDPTLGASNGADSVKKYIGDGSNYILKYSR